MSLHVLQHAATDKENLVGPGRIAIGGDKNKSTIENEKKMNENQTKVSFKKKKTTKVSSGENCKKAVTASDLTSEALNENQTLYEKIELLEQENEKAKEMLNEARCLIEVLNEIIDKNDSAIGDDAENNDSVIENVAGNDSVTEDANENNDSVIEDGEGTDDSVI
ncbi:Uncharacterized protein GBIM_02470 [Gryllus bimaculatus]|nr:Uncharacterized protein GBIM_02470 [Gryllus bimaculatus]